jgi:glutamine amidotransferase
MYHLKFHTWDGILFQSANHTPMLNGIKDETEFYFVHSYYPQPSDSSCIVALCEYE